jgi:hypothetical protein
MEMFLTNHGHHLGRHLLFGMFAVKAAFSLNIFHWENDHLLRHSDALVFFLLKYLRPFLDLVLFGEAAVKATTAPRRRRPFHPSKRFGSFPFDFCPTASQTARNVSPKRPLPSETATNGRPLSWNKAKEKTVSIG